MSVERFRVDSARENPERAPIEIWKVLKELEQKKITKAAFSKALGITEHQLTGRDKFPAEKVDECFLLLENWEPRFFLADLTCKCISFELHLQAIRGYPQCLKCFISELTKR